jgi:hypothetical protein
MWPCLPRNMFGSRVNAGRSRHGFEQQHGQSVPLGQGLQLRHGDGYPRGFVIDHLRRLDRGARPPYSRIPSSHAHTQADQGSPTCHCAAPTRDVVTADLELYICAILTIVANILVLHVLGITQESGVAPRANTQ